MLQARDPSTTQLPLMSGIVVVGSAALGSAVLLETGKADLKICLSTLMKVLFGGHAVCLVAMTSSSTFGVGVQVLSRCQKNWHLWCEVCHGVA